MRMIVGRWAVVGTVLAVVTLAGVSSAQTDPAYASSRLEITGFHFSIAPDLDWDTSLDGTFTQASWNASGSSYTEANDSGWMEPPASPSQATSSTSDRIITAEGSLTGAHPYVTAMTRALTTEIDGGWGGKGWISEDYVTYLGGGWQGMTVDVTVQVDYMLTYDLYTNPGSDLIALTGGNVNLFVRDGVDGPLDDYQSVAHFSGPEAYFSLGGLGNADGVITGSLTATVNMPTPWMLWVGYDAYVAAEVARYSEDPAPASVPAPGAMILAGLGAGLTGWLRRRRTM